MVFMCVNATNPDWIVIYDGRIPMHTIVEASGYQSINDSTVTQFTTFNTPSVDIGSGWDGVNFRFYSRRSKKIEMCGTGYIQALGDGKILYQRLYENGAQKSLTAASVNGASGFAAATIGVIADMAAVGNYWDLRLDHDHGTARDYQVKFVSFLEIF
jgi:hypothetical protein